MVYFHCQTTIPFKEQEMIDDYALLDPEWNSEDSQTSTEDKSETSGCTKIVQANGAHELCVIISTGRYTVGVWADRAGAQRAELALRQLLIEYAAKANCKTGSNAFAEMAAHTSRRLDR